MMEEAIIEAVFTLNDEEVIRLLHAALEQGYDPIELIQIVQQGVVKVGEYYDKGEYFIADLIMSGNIFNQVMKVLHFDNDSEQVIAYPDSTTKILFATARSDIHDIGKNINVNYLRARGLVITDLGVDCAPENVADAIDPDAHNILCLSCLLTTAHGPMKETVELLCERGLREKTTVIIGGQVSEEVKSYVGADYSGLDMNTLYDTCTSIIEIHLSENKK